MKRIFLDTNIVLDLLLRREPYSNYAVRIFTLAFNGHYQLYISTTTYTTAAYLMRKQPAETVKMLLKDLRSITHIAPSNDEVIDQALASNFSDIEDAIQAFSAKAANADCIVTRNGKDFISAEIPVYSPEEFLSKI